MRRGAAVLLGSLGCVVAQPAPPDWFTAPSCSGEADDDAVPGWIASPEACQALGRCVTDVQDPDNTATQINVKANKCAAGEEHVPYGVDNAGWLDATATPAGGASTPPGWTGASRFPADADGASCFALEGPPEQPTYKLPMCKMYNEKACCAPIHDAETQWAYETLVNVADRYTRAQLSACSSGWGGAALCSWLIY
eukprot:COSAG02_NODE_13299_length_1413_cov_0.824962_1_plen_196_part_00